ncbi:MAG: efflux RND transporter periplasmic adaptor subunit [Spirochaetaceae bacterium]|nr:efflux RND transporter periplasmic adaptor subunit [Spirochaetaceae bacterium]
MKKLVIIAVLFVSLLAYAQSGPGGGQGGGGGQNANANFNPNLSTVFTEAITTHILHRRINYGGRIEPIVSFPQYSTITGIVRQVNVRVGDVVQAGTALYSIQQIQPGAGFQVGWVTSLNAGVVAQVDIEVGQRLVANTAALVVADVSQLRLSFFMNERDRNRTNVGDQVTIASYARIVGEEEDRLFNMVRSNDERLARWGLTPDNTAAFSPEQLSLTQQAQRQITLQQTVVQQVRHNYSSSLGQIALLPIIPDSSTGLFRVQANFSSNAALTIGQFVEIELQVDRYEGLALWQGHIQRRYGQNQVRVVREGRIEFQEVIVGDRFGEMVAILGGLEEGDEIITGSNRRVIIGEEVNSVRRG